MKTLTCVLAAAVGLLFLGCCSGTSPCDGKDWKFKVTYLDGSADTVYDGYFYRVQGYAGWTRDNGDSTVYVMEYIVKTAVRYKACSAESQ